VAPSLSNHVTGGAIAVAPIRDGLAALSIALLLEQILNGLQLGVMLFLMAAGLTLIFGVMGLINLAHGSLYMVGAFACATVAAWTGSFWIGLAASLVAAAAAGAIVEMTVIRRLYDRDHLDQVLATFALILIFSEGTRWVFGSLPLYLNIPDLLRGTIPLPGGGRYQIYRLAIIAVGVAVAVGLWLLIAKTRLGMRIRAGESDREMIAALGIDIRTLYTVVFAIGAALAGLAGAMVGALAIGPGGHGRAGADPCLRGHRHRRHRVDQGRAGRRGPGRADRHDGPLPAAARLFRLHGSVGGQPHRLGDRLHADLHVHGPGAGVPPARPVRDGK
jgi:branched-subunit amino acid ABC-type transport system permease component